FHAKHVQNRTLTLGATAAADVHTAERDAILPKCHFSFLKWRQCRSRRILCRRRGCRLLRLRLATRARRLLSLGLEEPGKPGSEGFGALLPVHNLDLGRFRRLSRRPRFQDLPRAADWRT